MRDREIPIYFKSLLSPSKGVAVFLHRGRHPDFKGEKMKHTQVYFEGISLKIDECKESEEAEKLAEELGGVISALRAMRAFAGQKPDTAIDFLIAIDTDLENYEGLADKEMQRANAVADEILQEKEDEENYGTYEQQVRSIYNGGVL